MFGISEPGLGNASDQSFSWERFRPRAWECFKIDPQRLSGSDFGRGLGSALKAMPSGVLAAISAEGWGIAVFMFLSFRDTRIGLKNFLEKMFNFISLRNSLELWGP